jgi:glycerol-3-phosphate acyltransferase PlsX
VANRLIAPTMQRLRDTIDPEGPGGAYMLGLRQLGVVAHGRFSARGFAQAIDVAAHGVQQDVIGRTRAALQDAGALRPPRAAPGQADDLDGSSAPAATVSAP